MKNTDYYISGRHTEHNKVIAKKAKQKNHEMKAERIRNYDQDPNTCKQCGVKLEYEKSHNKFCSNSCSATHTNNHRNYNEEWRKKISDANKGQVPYSKGKKLNEHGKFVDPDVEEIDFEQVKANREAKRKETILAKDWNDMSWDLKRQRVIYEQEGKCKHCGIDEWHGKELTLEIDHIDGNNKNNVRENLEGLCPNCHSVTDTWRGRNKAKTTKAFITNEEKVKAYLETGNIRQALLKLGLAPKGSNYGQMKKALTEWGIEYK